MPGGQGEGAATRGDMVVYRAATNRRRGWNVPGESRPKIVETVIDILRLCPDERTRLSAARTLIAFDQSDQRDDQIDIAREQLELRKEEVELRRPPAAESAAPIAFEDALEKVYGDPRPPPETTIPCDASPR